MPRNRTENRKRTRRRKRTMILGTWNVQGISRKTEEVIAELNKMNIDLAVVTETKRKGQGSENLGSYDHFYSGVPRESRASKGVSVLIHRKWRKYIKTWEAVNERIIKINLNVHEYKVSILGIYAVNDDEPLNVKDSFFQHLNDEIQRIGATREVILLGDFNSRTGKRINDNIVGRYGEDKINNNGERLIAVCDQNNMRIMNGYFQHRDIHKYTWTQSTRGLRSIIDYVISKQKAKVILQDVKVCRGPVCGSDHFFVKTKVFFPGRKEKTVETHEEKRETLQQKRYNLRGLDDEGTRRLYKTRLDQKLNGNNFEDIEDYYNHIKEAIHAAAKEALGEYKASGQQQKPYWWDNDIESEIEEKRKRYQAYLSSKSMENKILYREAQKKVRKKISQKKNESWERNCSRINSYLGGTRSTESWRILKNIRSERRKEIISPITSKEWEHYFKQLLTEDRMAFKTDEVPNNIKFMGSPIRLTIEEIRKQCISLKNGKAPGPGDIYGELIKYGSNKLMDNLQKLFQKCLNKQTIPAEWKITYLTPIFKKGDRNNCENYRGIAVTGTISKLYGKVIKHRIENEYQGMEAEEQAGFRAGRSTIDHIFTITQVIEKKTAWNQELHLLFVDLKKAYDSVPLQQLWESLEKTSINMELIKSVKALYEQPMTKIKIGSTITEGFTTTKGLKQGCCLSPTLFKIYLESALNEWKKKCGNMGMPLNESILYTLCFADDQIVIAQDHDDMNYMMRKLIEEYEKWGLEVNLKKTEYMCLGGEREDLVDDNGQRIKQCDVYKYLGVKITKNGALDEAIHERNLQGRKAIAMLNSILWDRGISKENKHRIYNTIVKSIITYGSEVWPLKERTLKTLEATEMDFWRRAAGRSRIERITNTRIREIMNVDHTIVDDIRDKQLIWFGHVQRMPQSRLPKQVLEWRPGGKRKQGRPRKSWQSGINEDLKLREIEDGLWNDRDKWRLGIGRRRTL